LKFNKLGYLSEMQKELMRLNGSVPFYRLAAIFLVFVSMVGCSKEEPIRYPTYEQAMSEAAEGKKWLPTFLPVTSKNVVGAFDVDANQLAVEFEFPDGTFDVHTFGLREIESSLREQIVGEQKFPWWSKMQKNQSLEVLGFCDGGKLGALFVDQQGGRAYYTRPPSHVSMECNW
jgi:hypothetical protein